MDNNTWMISYTERLDFTLVGIFSQSQHPALLCLVISVVFLMALSGNIILIFLIYSDAHLHIPMYFFISQLSFMDMTHLEKGSWYFQEVG